MKDDLEGEPGFRGYKTRSNGHLSGLCTSTLSHPSCTDKHREMYIHACTERHREMYMPHLPQSIDPGTYDSLANTSKLAGLVPRDGLPLFENEKRYQLCYHSLGQLAIKHTQRPFQLLLPAYIQQALIPKHQA